MVVEYRVVGSWLVQVFFRVRCVRQVGCFRIFSFGVSCLTVLEWSYDFRVRVWVWFWRVYLRITLLWLSVN